jgi:chemotaxis protein methyltransferase CheR
MWQLAVADEFPGVAISILATDVDDAMLARARRGCYGVGSTRELPGQWRTIAFVERDGGCCVARTFREPVTLARHDLREDPPSGPFDLVMCRNLAFTYFDEDGQRSTAARLAGVLRGGGALVLGKHETLPEGVEAFEPWKSDARIYRRVGTGTPS